MKEVQSLGDIRFGTLARAAEGLTQWRPLLLAFLTLLLTGASITLGQILTIKVTAFLGLLMVLVAFVVLMAGFSGVGIMLMDKAKQEPVRSFAAAASAGLLCLPRFLLIGVIMTAAFIVYMIVASIIYFICKIPFIGGVIAFIAHPILVLVFAAVLVAMIWVIGPLMAPALWSGLPVKAALANVLAIARKRLIEVVMMEVVLYIILSLICVLLFAGLVPASASLTMAGMGIMSDSNMLMSAVQYGGQINPLAMMMAGGGNTWGLTAGLGVLYCVVGALLTQVGIMGMNLIYLQARNGVNTDDAQNDLNDLMGDVRKKAGEAKERARQAAQDLAAKKNSNGNDAANNADAAPASYHQASGDFQQPGTAAGASSGVNTAAGVSAAAAGFAAATPSFGSEPHESMAREQAMAAEQARIAAENEAARQRAETEAARLRAEAEQALQAQQAAAELAAREQAMAAERAAAEEARRRAEAEAAAQAAEQQRLQEQAEAAERAARERAQAAEQAAREREAQAQAQAAEQERLREQQRLREQAEAEARQRAQREAAEREAAEREAAAREAARVKAQAQAEAEEKARQAAATPSCPSCHAHVSPADVFCGECGHKLK